MAQLHIFQVEDGWEVWIDTEVTPKDGLCIGFGANKEESLISACREFERLCQQMRELIVEPRQ